LTSVYPPVKIIVECELFLMEGGMLPVPEQRAPDTSSLLLRLPKSWKNRLAAVAKQLQEKHPDGKFSSTSIARNAVIARIKALEQELREDESPKNILTGGYPPDKIGHDRMVPPEGPPRE